jgi:alanyl-tRNA synthetase
MGRSTSELFTTWIPLGDVDYELGALAVLDGCPAARCDQGRRDGAGGDPGEIVEVVLDKTSFYAESGGQIADEGVIELDGSRLRVLDVQKALKELIVHQVQVESGELRPGLDARAKVDPEWRLSARQAHSGTHVVHAALREVLGPTALQSGSYNKPGYLRLDFAWPQALDERTRGSIEESANLALRRDLPVTVSHMPLSR